jgi:hypothetical protein
VTNDNRPPPGYGRLLTAPAGASARFALGDEAACPVYYTPQAAAVSEPGTVTVILGYTPSGRAVSLHVTSLAWLDDLESAVRAARAQDGDGAGMAVRS